MYLCFLKHRRISQVSRGFHLLEGSKRESLSPSPFWFLDPRHEKFPSPDGWRGCGPPTHGCHYEPSTSPATLSSEFWRNFLPAGKDFTIPAPNFLPAGIPFLELPKQGQSVRRFLRFRRFHTGHRRNLIGLPPTSAGWAFYGQVDCFRMPSSGS